MTIFASVDPITLNADEFPWLTPEGNRRSETWLHSSTSEATYASTYDPRPEYTPATVHSHNPILAVLRKDDERHEPWILDDYLTALDVYANDPDSEFDEDGELRLATYFQVSRCAATPEHIVHAVLVLERMKKYRMTNA
jgi:hypothetical protein